MRHVNAEQFDKRGAARRCRTGRSSLGTVFTVVMVSAALVAEERGPTPRLLVEPAEFSLALSGSAQQLLVSEVSATGLL
ncbi:MAG: hypothetical protein AB7I48_19570 [Planctomycetaceae bacterium]